MELLGTLSIITATATKMVQGDSKGAATPWTCAWHGSDGAVNP